jgi:hypothetical protein
MAESKDHNRSTESAPVSSEIRYLIADEQRWAVREVPAPQFDRRGGVHLVFWGDTTMRRLRNFPANWHELSDEELYALTERIESEPKRDIK